MTLLPNKKLLIWNWDRDGASGFDFRTWIAADLSVAYDYKSLTEVSFPYTPMHDHELFCAGHALTYDGKLFAAGGHEAYDKGVYRTKLYDYASGTNGTWAEAANMNPIPTDFPATGSGYDTYGRRWYPTVLHLPSRRMLIMGGTRFPGGYINLLPEIWAPQFHENSVEVMGQFPPKYNSQQELQHNHWYTRAYYPHAIVDPRDGNVLIFGASIRNEDSDLAGDFQGKNKRLDLVTMAYTDIFPYSNGSGTSDDVPAPKENYPSAVLVDGILLRSGGSANGGSGALNTANGEPPGGDATNATKNACFLKLVNWDGTNVSSPVWEKAPNAGATADQMYFARKNHTLVALPTGEVVAFGGNLARNNPEGTTESNPNVPDANGKYSISGAADRTAPELWNPLSPGDPWIALQQPDSDQRIGRPYHSTAVLLPSGKVIVGGGEKESVVPNSAGDLKRTFQIFSPPYGGSNTWEADRPTWFSNPHGEFWYGQSGTLSIEVASGRQVSKIALVSLGSTTHAFTANQRVVFLAKSNLPTTGSGTTKSVSVTMPASPKLAPPGYYMLFAVDNQGTGVPSEAKIIRLRDHEPLGLYDADIVSGAPGSGSTAGSTLIVACNDYFAGQVSSVNVNNTQTVEIDVDSFLNLWTSVKEIRAHVEASTSANTTLEVLVRKQTSPPTWESWGTASMGSTETLVEKLKTWTTGQTIYFDDNNDPGYMRAKLRWTANSSFTVKLDAFELAVKQ